MVAEFGTNGMDRLRQNGISNPAKQINCELTEEGWQRPSGWRKNSFPEPSRGCIARFIDSFLPSSGRFCREIKTINLKFDRPTVQLALERDEP
jgi:hypothetical protein